MKSLQHQISVLGLSLGLLLLTGCGAGFESSNKGKKVAGAALPQAALKTPEQLAEEAQERALREDELRRTTSNHDELQPISDAANLFVKGVQLKREGSLVVFRSVLKEASQDNKASVELTAELNLGADGQTVKTPNEQLKLQAVKKLPDGMVLNELEYAVHSTCSESCSRILIRIQRKSSAANYAAQFQFEMSEIDQVGVLKGSSLQADARGLSYEEALIGAKDDLQTAEGEITEDETAPAAADAEKTTTAETGNATPAETAPAEAAPEKTETPTAETEAPTAATETPAVSAPEEKIVTPAPPVVTAPAAAPAKAAPAANVDRQKLVTQVRSLETQVRNKVAQVNASKNTLINERNKMRRLQAEAEAQRIQSVKHSRLQDPYRLLYLNRLKEKRAALERQIAVVRSHTNTLTKQTGELKKMTDDLKSLKSRLGQAQ